MCQPIQRDTRFDGEVIAFFKPNYIISKKNQPSFQAHKPFFRFGERQWLLAAANQLCVGYGSRPGLFDQHCSARGVLSARGHGHRLPHLPGLGLRGAALVRAMCVLRLH